MFSLPSATSRYMFRRDFFNFLNFIYLDLNCLVFLVATLTQFLSGVQCTSICGATDTSILNLGHAWHSTFNGYLPPDGHPAKDWPL